jgi:hypothetical protein
MQKKNQEYHGGRIKGLVELVARLVAGNPRYAEDPAYLHARLRGQLDGYGKPESCYNCNRSMLVSVYTADILDGLLILAMAREVRRLQDEGLPFTEANQVYLPELPVTQGVLKRQTKCDYLGLIKQPKGLKGTGRWVLTEWAWNALRGGTIPRSAHYWEGRLIKRSEETTTLTEMFRTHTDLVEAAIARSKAPRSDYRAAVGLYSASDWSEYAGSVTDQLV